MMNSNVKVLQNSEISNGVGGGLFRIVTKLSNLVFGPYKNGVGMSMGRVQ
jgi:hypothetical protein